MQHAKYYYYYGPGDAIARISRSSMVALHTLLSCVLHVASCSVRCSSLQSSLIMSIHLFFCLPLFLVPCTYPLHAILRYRSFFIRFRCPKYRSRLFRILSIIPILIFSLLKISSFLILSLLVTPSIFRRHAISNTLSLCFCFSFIVHVSALYSSVLNTSTSYIRVFVALLSSLEFHTFPSACQVPLANPILLSTSLSDPSCVLMFPPRYTKFSVCSNSCPSTSRRNFLFPSLQNRHSVFCMFIFMPIFAHLGDFCQRLL